MNNINEQFRAWCQHQILRLVNYVSYWVHDQALAEDLTAGICEQALKVTYSDKLFQILS